MLYLIFRANHPELAYRGGQGPIVHLEADLAAAIDWAEAQGRPWAFSLSNAAALYTKFLKERSRLSEVDWDAVAARDRRAPAVKEAKQSEFLVHHSFPWCLVTRVAVQSRATGMRVESALAAATHRPNVEIRPEWYY